MKILGVDLAALEEHKLEEKKVYIPPVVKGRVAHIDGDFLAYQVSASKQHKTLDQMYHNCEKAAEKLRMMSGSEKMVLHLTPKTSNKGGRFEIAMLKEYQSSRKGKPKPVHLHLVRDFMTQVLKAVDHEDCEADDGMSSAQYATKNKNLSIIVSKDKDLSMVPGLAMDWDTGAITDTKDKPFGWIELFRDKAQPKIKGRGWKYFWAQVLTGDPADTISGLPAYYDGEKEKFIKCGPVAADAILREVTTNKDAFELVRWLYKDHEQRLRSVAMDEPFNEPFVDWRDGRLIGWQQALISEMKLLWMRRVKSDPDDVINWLKENGV